MEHCVILKEMALLKYKKRILKKLIRAQLTYHYQKALSQSDSLLVDILSSLLKYDGKVPNLTLNIKITNTTTADNICTQGNDASLSLSQLVDESENEVPLRGTSKKAIFVVIMYLT